MNEKTIKVAHYKSSFLPITENWIYRQITGLDDVSVVFYAIVRENEENFPFDKLRCLKENRNLISLFYNRAWRRIFHSYPQFQKWLQEDKPDLIHAHFGSCGYNMLPYARHLGIPLITSFYGQDAYMLPKSPQWIKRYRELFEYGQLFLTEGPAMRRKLIQLGCPEEKIIVHHIGIKIEDYKFQARDLDNEIRLMTCGRFVEKKGIPYAIEVLILLKSKYGDRISLTIVGDSDSAGTMTDEKTKIQNIIAKYKIADSVTITGYIPHNELMKIAKNHHIYLAPSIHTTDGDAEGGFPVILTEIIATGMSVVAFDHCDIPEIIKQDKSGYLVHEKDVNAMTEKLEFIIEHPEIRQEMGRYGRKLVEEQFDIKMLNKRLVEIYRNLIRKNL